MPKISLSHLRWLLVAFAIYNSQFIHAAQAGEPGSQTVYPDSGETVESLIEALGAKSFSMREAAMRRLFDAGMTAVPALRKVSDSEDREVRLRAARAIAEIARRDRPRRLAELVSGAVLEPSDSRFGIPGLSLYFSTVGDTPQSRSLLGRALRTEWDMLDAVCTRRVDCFDILEDRCNDIRQQRSNKSIPPSTMAALLLAAIHAPQSIPDRTAIQIYSMLSQMNDQIPVEIDGKVSIWEHDAFRRLVGAFVLRSDGPTAVYQGLNTSLRHNIPEGLSTAERVVHGGFALPHIRQFAVLTIARFGGPHHIVDLQHLVDDRQVYYTRRAHHRDLRFECQVGDLAMASILHLAGQDPMAFGFRDVKTSDCYVFQPHTVGFESEADRQAARTRFQVFFLRAPFN